MPQDISGIFPFLINPDIASLEHLLADGFNLNEQHIGKKGRTPLTFLLRHYKKHNLPPNWEFLHWLCNRGADWELVDGSGKTPDQLAQTFNLSPDDQEELAAIRALPAQRQLAVQFFNAIGRADYEQLYYYIQQGFDLNQWQYGKRKETPLTFLLRHYQKASPDKQATYMKILRLFSGRGAASWILPDGSEQTPQQLAESIGLVPHEIQQVAADEFVADIQLRAQFFCALVKNDQEQLIICLEQGFDLNSWDTVSVSTADEDTKHDITLVLDPDVGIQIPDSLTQSGIQWRLVSRPANVRTRLETPLTFLLRLYQTSPPDQRSQLIQTIRWLSEHDANWRQPDGNGTVPLQVAESIPELKDFTPLLTQGLAKLLHDPDLERLEAWLRQDADPNVQLNKKGQTPLIKVLAYCQKHPERLVNYQKAIRLLVQYGADLELADGAGQTPVQLIHALGWDVDVLLLPEHINQQAITALSEMGDDDWEEKFIQPTTIPKAMLWLGAGNMSLELSFAQKHPDWSPYMTVTTYETEEEFNNNFAALRGKECDPLANKQALMKLGVTVWHGIDATQLHTYSFMREQRFTRIHFSHPHTGDFNTTASMLKQFFASASQVQSIGDNIHIIRLRGGDKTCFPASDNPEADASRNQHYQKLYGFLPGKQFSGYQLARKHRFNHNRYPKFSHMETRHPLKSATNVTEDNSIEYVFVKTADPGIVYDSLAISSDSRSEVFSVMTFSRVSQTPSVVSSLPALGEDASHPTSPGYELLTQMLAKEHKTLGQAQDNGDCFFDSVAQGLNACAAINVAYSAEQLRHICSTYIASMPEDNWVKRFVDARGLETWEQYHDNIALPADQAPVAIWGQIELEGRIIADDIRNNQQINLYIRQVSVEKCDFEISSTGFIEADSVYYFNDNDQWLSDNPAVRNPNYTIEIALYRRHVMPIVHTHAI